MTLTHMGNWKGQQAQVLGGKWIDLEGTFRDFANPVLLKSERRCFVPEYVLPSSEWNWERISYMHNIIPLWQQ